MIRIENYQGFVIPGNKAVSCGGVDLRDPTQARQRRKIFQGEGLGSRGVEGLGRYVRKRAHIPLPPFFPSLLQLLLRTPLFFPYFLSLLSPPPFPPSLFLFL